MNKTKIEWVKNPDGSPGYTINPVKGLCPVACSYCYARRMYQRFKWNPRIRYDPRAWLGIGSLRKPSRIFVGSTIELFHESLSEQYLKWIFEVPLEFPQHTFIFLTKKPENLPREFPDNCWVGVTATDESSFANATNYLYTLESKVKFISVEPLLSWDTSKYVYPFREGVHADDISWLIIGGQTNPEKLPKIEWVQEIALAATKANIRLFIKDNLRSLLPHRMPFWDAYSWWSEDRTHQLCEHRLRQEMPDEGVKCKGS